MSKEKKMRESWLCDDVQYMNRNNQPKEKNMEHKTIYDRYDDLKDVNHCLLSRIKKFEEENKMLSDSILPSEIVNKINNKLDNIDEYLVRRNIIEYTKLKEIESKYEFLMKKIAQLEIKLNEINFDYSTINEHEERISSLENKPEFDEVKEPEEVKKYDLNFAEALQLLQSGEAKKISRWFNSDSYIYLDKIYLPEGREDECHQNKYSPYLFVKTLAGTHSIWTPHHNDMLEAKWRVVE